MVSADRQIIMETNRSLRNIKTELENLLEKGVIDEAVFDQIHATLPQESSLSGPLRTTNGNASTTAARDSPAPVSSSTSSPPPPTQQMQKLGINNRNPATTSPSPGPPSYDQTPAPDLPNRSVKPALAHARALYRYVASDNRDVSFEKDDKIIVHQYMNQDWWMGQNTRTGQEGIFPRNYVLVENEEQKSAPYAPYAQPQYGYPSPGQGPPQQQNPYNSSVPPVAVAEGGQPASGEQQQGGDNKVGQYGKKFGKKLGNAAIFGAGATIGGNIVNSIF
ncbi:SH3 domain containing protein [Metarhizium rileyi]|uniref:SH3 domain containing protein n=1 Tax=Metarhizium rileyi (strain RCEF 4871) TaxID=1649241 RepID=A0A162JJ27_METRR|nr:SH3 domain containing protein [Metarhizium rileyi RCEF 4871]TWU74625.1 hypothetical protein ED733_002253 [Metarhizium rileyi]